MEQKYYRSHLLTALDYAVKYLEEKEKSQGYNMDSGELYVAKMMLKDVEEGKEIKYRDEA